MSCYCDAPSPDIYEQMLIRARKEHKCSECHSSIKKGETYERTKGLWDGDFRTYKTCSDCLKIRKALEEEMGCFCLVHELLIDDFYEALQCSDFMEAIEGLEHRDTDIIETIEEKRGDE